MLLKVSQGLQENITVLEFIVKFILKFSFKSILKVYFRSLFYKSILQNTSGRLLLQKVFWYFICWYVEYLEGVITRYCASISILNDKSLHFYSWQFHF